MSVILNWATLIWFWILLHRSYCNLHKKTMSSSFHQQLNLTFKRKQTLQFNEILYLGASGCLIGLFFQCLTWGSVRKKQPVMSHSPHADCVVEGSVVTRESFCCKEGITKIVTPTMAPTPIISIKARQLTTSAIRFGVLLGAWFLWSDLDTWVIYNRWLKILDSRVWKVALGNKKDCVRTKSFVSWRVLRRTSLSGFKLLPLHVVGLVD